MQNLWQDLRYGARMLTRQPGFTAIAVLTLALGIGANAAVFSIVQAVLWRALPFVDPGRLVLVHEARPTSRTAAYTAMPNYADWRDGNRVFESIAAYSDLTFNLTGVDEPERLDAIEMSASLLTVIGVQPMLGRGFRSEDDRRGAPGTAILSHELWQRRYGGDRNVIGRSVVLNDRPHTVIGVMPPGIQFPVQADPIDIYTPIELDEFPQMRLRDGRLVRVVARLKPDVTLEQAQADMTVIARRLEQAYPATNTGWGALVAPLHDETVGSNRRALLTLFAAVGFVLLIACTNLTNLFAARATVRQREMSVRAALGATRARLVRLALAEHLLLGLAGGAVGLVGFAWLRDGIVAVAPGSIPRLRDASLDATTLLFGLGAALAAGFLSGLVPALSLARPRLQLALQDRGMVAGATRTRARSLLVVAEVAMAMVMLTGAGLMVKSLARILSVDPGFDPSNVVSIALELPRAAYSTPDAQARYYADVVERATGTGGARIAAVAFPLPFGSPVAFPFRMDGAATDARTGAYYRTVSERYFEALRIPLVRGRTFTSADRMNGPAVVVINESMAARFWPGDNAIGRRITVIDRNNEDLETSREIVGIVGDVKHLALDRPSGPEMYVPFQQAPSLWAALIVRGDGESAAAGDVARRIRDADPNVPITRVELMAERVTRSVAPRRFIAVLLGLFAFVAVTLTMVGIGGMTAYAVTQRTPEIGIRMALGAQRGDVLRLMLSGTLRVALAGVTLGVAAATGLTRLLSTLLFGVQPIDVTTFAIAAFGLFALTMLAALWPARRATTVDPLIALRE